MKKLRKQFTSRGFEHTQLQRTGNLAIYKRQKKEDSSPHFEVVKIGHHNGYKLGKSYIEAAETYPSASMWGIAGWTCGTEDLAHDKFNELKKYIKS